MKRVQIAAKGFETIAAASLADAMPGPFEIHVDLVDGEELRRWMRGTGGARGRGAWRARPCRSQGECTR